MYVMKLHALTTVSVCRTTIRNHRFSFFALNRFVLRASAARCAPVSLFCAPPASLRIIGRNTPGGTSSRPGRGR
jgi:hypothetical protein